MRSFHILPQPDDSSCGPTALHAVYVYFGIDISLDTIRSEVVPLEEGGTLSVLLGIHALEHGLKAKMYSYNMRVLDPTWASMSSSEMRDRILLQMKHRRNSKLRLACKAYARFLELGGEFAFDELDSALLHRYLDQGIPVLTGLSATYLYRSMRESTDENGRLVNDDLRGEATGHFVVLIGRDGDRIRIADPYQDNPFSPVRLYDEKVGRVINSILLGAMTYDANLLILSPSET